MQTTLDAFHAEINVLQKCVTILQKLRSANSISATDKNSLPNELKEMVELSQSDPRIAPGILETLLILLVSRSEFFIKEIFKKLCDQAYCGITANLIPEEIKKHVIKKSIEIIRNENKYGISSAQKFSVLSNIAKLGNDSETILDINADCLAISRQIDSEELQNLFNPLCRNADIWKIISQQTEFRQHFGGIPENEAMKKGKSTLDEIINKRNDITHPNGELFCSAISAEILLQMMSYLKVLSEQIRGYCSMEVAAIKASRTPPP